MPLECSMKCDRIRWRPLLYARKTQDAPPMYIDEVLLLPSVPARMLPYLDYSGTSVLVGMTNRSLEVLLPGQKKDYGKGPKSNPVLTLRSNPLLTLMGVSITVYARSALLRVCQRQSMFQAGADWLKEKRSLSRPRTRRSMTATYSILIPLIVTLSLLTGNSIMVLI